MEDRQTIFARASGGGRAAVAIVRLSGPSAGAAVSALAGPLPAPRVATLSALRDPGSGELLDRALVLWFPGPRSFTGEDAAELHLHGGRAVVEGVLQALAGLPGMRPAEPGEFTRRAFRNRKMDLTEVEGLADLIEADTAMQRRQALRQLDGALGRWAEGLRQTLVEALGLAEAMIDFAEEDDLIADHGAELRRLVQSVADRVAAQLALAGRGERLRDGIVVTIAGPPNVGKSTLLNALAGREVAIVSAFAGTTRDAIEVDLDLGGHAVRLIDTAGLRETDDPVEREGIARAKAKAATADLVLWLDDGPLPPAERPGRAELWTIRTKADLPLAGGPADFTLSAATGIGLDVLIEALADFAARNVAGEESALVTRVRHRQALEAAQHHLLGFLDRDGSTDLELVAEDLRSTTTVLAALVGEVANEDVLGTIFARFCIGK